MSVLSAIAATFVGLCIALCVLALIAHKMGPPEIKPDRRPEDWWE